MGIPLHHLPAKYREAACLGIPTKPVRAARGCGAVGRAKAAVCAAIRERSTADVAVTIDVRTVNPLNRGHGGNHWRVEAGHRKRVRVAVQCALVGAGQPPRLPVFVTLTRVSPGTLDLHDAVPAALKGVVDELARWLGVDDGDAANVAWRYAQRRERGVHAVEVLVRHVAKPSDET